MTAAELEHRMSAGELSEHLAEMRISNAEYEAAIVKAKS